MLLANTLAALSACLSIVAAVPIDSSPVKATPTSPNPAMSMNRGIDRRCLGLNCHGSAFCNESLHDGSVIQALIDAVQTGPVDSFLQSDFIACVDYNICVFYQGTSTKRRWTREETIGYLKTIQTNKCKICGSVPVNPGNCHTNGGELTVNYVGV